MNPRLAALAATALVVLTACGPQQGPGPTPSATTSAPTKPSTLTFDGLKVGAAPKIAWSRESDLNGDATKDVLPPKLDQFAETKQLLVMRDIDGNVFAYSPDSPKSTTPIGKATGSLAVNDERNLVAWIAPDGSPTVLQEGEAKPATLMPQEGVTSGDVVAVLGHDCFNGPETVEGAGCSVFFRAHGEKPQSFVASNHGFVEPIGDSNSPVQLQDADESGEVGWTTLKEDQTTCSTYWGHQTLDADTAKSWKTCDHLPLAFSPDGKHILATAPHGFEGAGAGSIAILDRSNGKELWSVQNTAESQVFITDMVWEDDDHILASVNDGREAAIIRVGIDGGMELAAKPVPLDDEAVNPLPYRLSVQP